MDQLLVALDVDTAKEATEMAGTLRDLVGGYKIGSRLFTREGPPLVRALVEHGDRVFLALKYHDIPSVVRSALHSASSLGVWMATVHTSGGKAMMLAAKEGAHSGQGNTKVVGVTVLTSFDEDGLGEIGISTSVATQVDLMAKLASDAGLDGIVASPLELARLRSQHGREFTIVTPGIRNLPSGDDQTRTLNAQQAIEAGASYIVVGRPIIKHADPRIAAENICEQMTGS